MPALPAFHPLAFDWSCFLPGLVQSNISRFCIHFNICFCKDSTVSTFHHGMAAPASLRKLRKRLYTRPPRPMRQLDACRRLGLSYATSTDGFWGSLNTCCNAFLSSFSTILLLLSRPNLSFVLCEWSFSPLPFWRALCRSLSFSDQYYEYVKAPAPFGSLLSLETPFDAKT